MIPVDFGAFDDPWQAAERMTDAPMIHPTAAVKRSRRGAWTVRGPNARLAESDFGEYAYTARGDICNADAAMSAESRPAFASIRPKKKLATMPQDFRALSAAGFAAKYDPDA